MAKTTTPTDKADKTRAVCTSRKRKAPFDRDAIRTLRDKAALAIQYEASTIEQLEQALKELITYNIQLNQQDSSLQPVKQFTLSLSSCLSMLNFRLELDPELDLKARLTGYGGVFNEDSRTLVPALSNFYQPKPQDSYTSCFRLAQSGELRPFERFTAELRHYRTTEDLWKRASKELQLKKKPSLVASDEKAERVYKRLEELTERKTQLQEELAALEEQLEEAKVEVAKMDKVLSDQVLADQPPLLRQLNELRKSMRMPAISFASRL